MSTDEQHSTDQVQDPRGGWYDESMRLRAIDGINAHGSLDLYLSDFRACAKLFEMYVADHLTRKFDCRDRPFLLWEDIDHETKEARGLTGADTGVDVTDGGRRLCSAS